MSFPWPEVVEKALTHHSTPFYLSAWSPVEAAVFELSLLESTLPVKHWLSFKTHPIAPLVRSWRRTNRGIEVVSEFELRAATSEGFHPQRILVNGVGKHGWLQNHEFNDLWVNFDSLEEVEALTRRPKPVP